METGLYINGEWRPSLDGARIEVIDPATEEIITDVASASKEDALLAVEAAHAAQPLWAARPPRERAEILRRAFDL
ncbi:hypothetical protein JCM17846_17510 [Iodidimonas nitroreducens]|uniref:Aldehyde dehydrogenase domain-containing protein n=1 Tax=Iodidimonas nitroreducens TaxID=1236968 RepID=A0A5A7NAK8_9PROT|nr:hypothetical protein JCM17846_17510 [Iodidimonas nitroreducens]